MRISYSTDRLEDRCFVGLITVIVVLMGIGLGIVIYRSIPEEAPIVDVAPEDGYQLKVNCKNCDFDKEITIPLGMSGSKYCSKKPCPKCGCKSLIIPWISIKWKWE